MQIAPTHTITCYGGDPEKHGIGDGYTTGNGAEYDYGYHWRMPSDQYETSEGDIGPWASTIPSWLLDMAVSAGVIDRQILESTRVLR